LGDWKNNAILLLINEYTKKIKDSETRKILLDARKEFLKIRKNQEIQFVHLYSIMFSRINSYLSGKSGKNSLTPKIFSELYNLIDSLFIFLIGEQVYNIKNNVLRSIKFSTDIPNKIFLTALTRSDIGTKDILKNNITKVLTYKNDKVFDLVFDYSWGKKKTTLSKKIWDSNIRSKKAIKKIIEYYEINRINDPRKLAQDLEGYLKQSTPVSKRLRKLIPGIPKNVSYEALRVARSEINQGFTQGLYTTSNETYGYQGIYWVLSSRHPEVDICTEYANQKKYGEKGFFPKGKEPRVPHPNCLCTQIAKYADIDNLVDELIEWEKNPNKNKKLDDYIKSLNRRAGQL